MIIRWLLLWAPIALAVFLLQSCLWVPNFHDQPQSGTDRSSSFVLGSIADAKVLNPILSSDGASSQIVELVFDGLLTLDEDNGLLPRLAKSWSLSERILVAAPTGDAEAFLPVLRRFIEADDFLSARVQGLSLSEPVQRSVPLPEQGDDKPTAKLGIKPRVMVELDSVVADFEQRLGDLVRDIDIADSVSIPEEHADTVDTALVDLHFMVVEHNPVLEFQLRDDAYFHDGHRFDAKDVVFTWRAIMDPKNLSPRTSSFEPVQSVQAAGDFAVKVIYKRLFFFAVLAWVMPILPEHLLNDDAMSAEMDRRDIGDEARETFGMRQVEFNRNPVGTGPYRFVEWRSDELIRLRATGKHYADSPELREYVYRVLPDSLAQELELSSGSVDIYAPQPYQIERFREDDRFQTLSLPGNGYAYIGYNNRLEKFSDVRVRKALSMAIDRESLIRYVLYGEAQLATGPFAVSTQWHDKTIEPVPYDPEGAIALLREAGYVRNAEGWFEKNGELLEFSLITNQGARVREAIMSVAQDAWRRIGVRVSTQKFEWAVFLEDFVNPGDFDAVVLGWSLGVSPDQYQLWHSSQTGFAQLNFVGYQSQAVDELIVQLRQEYDPARQLTLAHNLHRQIADDFPYTFLFASNKNAVLARSLRERGPDGKIESIRHQPSGELYRNFVRWTRSGPQLTSGEG